MDKKLLNLIKSGLQVIFSLIGFFLMSTPFVKLPLTKITGFDFLGDIFRENHKYFLDTDLDLGVPWILFVFLISLGLLIGAIIDTIVYGLIYTGKIKEKSALRRNEPKSDMKNPKQAAIVLLVVSMVVGVVYLILSLCTLSLTGYDDIPLAELGSGAIVSGVMGLLSVTTNAVFLIIPMFYQNDNTRTKHAKTKNTDEQNWIIMLKGIKELYDAGVLSEEEFINEKYKIMEQRKEIENEENEIKNKEYEVKTIEIPKQLSGKYANGNTKIIIENERFFEIKSKGLVISQGRVNDEGKTIVLLTKDNKKMTLTRQGADLVTIKGIVYKKQ